MMIVITVVFRQPVDAVNKRQRVECTVVGPVSQDQSLVTNGFLSQIITVLQSRNFGEQDTEQSSGKLSCMYNDAWLFYVCIYYLNVKINLSIIVLLWARGSVAHI